MKNFKESPIESISAIIGFMIISIGIIISQSDSNFDFLGDLLTFLGSILASVATTWVVGRSIAQKQLSSKLDIIRGQLATATAEISHSVGLGVDDDEDPYISLIKINQSLSNLSMVLSELEKLTDSRLSSENENIILAKTNILELGKSLNKFVDANKYVGYGTEKTTKELSNLVNKFNNTLSSLDKVPYGKNVNLRIKKIPKENITSPDEKILARLRKYHMQFIGVEQQEIVVKAIHDELLSPNEFRTTRDIRDQLIENRLNKLISYKALSKSKVNGVLKVFFKTKALLRRKLSDLQPAEIKLSELYTEYEDFKRSHDHVFIAISDLLGISRKYVHQILNLEENYNIDDELINYSKEQLTNPGKTNEELEVIDDKSASLD